MKRILLVIVALAAAMLLCLPASADHSVLPKEGDLNETEALNCAVELLCVERGLTEDDVRGHWYYYATYYEKSSWAGFSDYSGSYWHVSMINPAVSGEETKYGRVYLIHELTVYCLRADTGMPLDDDGYKPVAVETKDEPSDWRYPLVPTAEQMKPDEVIGAAQALLSGAVGTENIQKWKHYYIIALTDNGRFWYRVTIGNSSIGLNGYLSFTAWIDADTRQVIWHSNLDRLGFRYHIRQTAGSWFDWYDQQEAAYEAEGGDSSTWNYLQNAEFEEHCGGSPMVPEQFYGLPEEDEIGYEQACSKAIAWQTAQDDAAKVWRVKGSAFVVDVYLWNWIEDMMIKGIPPKLERRWVISLISNDPEPATVVVYIDPATGEIADGPVG